MPDPRLTILLPVYNEHEIIGRTLDLIFEKVKTTSVIRVVYDFDADTTIPVVRKYMEKHANLEILRNDYGKGVLNALKKGFDSVTTEWTLVMMADLSDDPGLVDGMIAKGDEGYDLVSGSRYMKGGKQEGGPWLKRKLSRIAGISLHYLVGIATHDITTAFKLYRTSFLKTVKIESTGGFEVSMEITVKAFLAGRRIGEVPATWLDRTAGQSRFNLKKWLPKYLHWYWVAVSGARSRVRS